ncbi:virulence RhuM family protein [Pedosphaera parvula]|uniref:Virulence protein-like protein n=1 Tax=Pedosphaera parvula (strain Ellin514) TaxID=320771 RepID=B9XBH7_PEDPL|nr:virulence RhuM family protein [Pedosphaera parvula]EEF62862.1 virulence protein-like protein [Pedosphaera parvula Ellin514]
MTKNNPEANPGGEVILYLTEDQQTRMQVRLLGGTVWLSLNQIAELFQRDKSVISRHIANVFEERELQRDSVVANFATTATDGKTYQVDFFNLELIISVGYRVKSQRGTQFRQWATSRLKEYLVKGFVLDDERLKNPPGLGVADYFDELLERIRDIRASERRMYLRVKEVLALAADYKVDEAEVQVFFQTVQNKLHYAVSGKTAPELIAKRADHNKPNMGLTSWKGGVVRKGDVTVAKNYLNKKEIAELNRIVVMFLDYAEDQASRRKQVFMRDWRTRLDEFLRFNERQVLPDSGNVSREEASRRAEEQYALFEKRRRAEMESSATVALEADLKLLEEQAKELSKPKRKRS